MISFTLDNRNERISAITTVVVHVLILLIAIFFVTCYRVPNPPKDPEQGIQIAFGTIVEDKGDTEVPLDAAPKEALVAPVPEVEPVVEDVIEPVAEVDPVVEDIIDVEPLDSEHLVEEVEKIEVKEQDIIPEPVEEVIEEPVDTPIETVSSTEDIEDNDDLKEEEPEKKPVLEGLVGLGDLDGGSGVQTGTVGDPNETEKSRLGSGNDVNISKGWGVVSEPRPGVKEDGTVTVRVEFDKSGEIKESSIRCVADQCEIFDRNKDLIIESIMNELKIELKNTDKEPGKKNKADFTFVFKKH